jgi:tetratricopeptide (TPR) repeat protein
MSFFWRQVVARSPSDSTHSTAYEDGWNAINQFIREGYSWNGHERNVFYKPEGGRYRDASVDSGLDFAGDSRAFAITDIDGDGCLDLLVKNRLAPQLRVFQNRCGQVRDRIAFRLIGVHSNRDAIGARVTVGSQVKWLSAGSGYLSQHTKILYFGLPDEQALRTVEVVWPSGHRQRITGLQPNGIYEITEGQSHRLLRAFATQTVISPAAALADNAPRLHDTWFHDPVPLPERRAGPGLLILHDGSISAAGAQQVDLSRNSDLLAAYSLFRRYLFEYRADLDLPLALLLNADGHAVRIYANVPDAATAKSDLGRIATRQPLPYAGIALAQPRRDYFKLGAALLWSGYGEQALPYLELVLKQQPGNTRTMIYAAQIHREAGRLTAASTLLEDALRRDPESAEAWNESGGVALAQEKPAEAMKHFEQALKAKPDLIFALLNAAQTADRIGNPALAESYYRRALAAHPRSGEAASGLGLLLAKAGRNQEAEVLLKQAVDFEPALSTAWSNLAVLYSRLQRIQDAVDALENGIRHSPREESLYLNLGRIYVQAGDREKARAAMRRLLEVRPDSPVARNALKELQ